MQEIQYEDGEKTKKKFTSIIAAISDAGEKSKQKQIKSLKITRIIPRKRKKSR